MCFQNPLLPGEKTNIIRIFIDARVEKRIILELIGREAKNRFSYNSMKIFLTATPTLPRQLFDVG